MCFIIILFHLILNLENNCDWRYTILFVKKIILQYTIHRSADIIEVYIVKIFQNLDTVV